MYRIKSPVIEKVILSHPMIIQRGVGGGGMVHAVDVCPFPRSIVAAKRIANKRDMSDLSAHIIAILAI